MLYIINMRKFLITHWFWSFFFISTVSESFQVFMLSFTRFRLCNSNVNDNIMASYMWLHWSAHFTCTRPIIFQRINEITTTVEKTTFNGEPVVLNSSWKSLLVLATHRVYEQSPRIKWEQPLWFLFLVLANNYYLYYSKWENCIFSSRVLLLFYKIYYWWRKDFTSLYTILYYYNIDILPTITA